MKQKVNTRIAKHMGSKLFFRANQGHSLLRNQTSVPDRCSLLDQERRQDKLLLTDGARLLRGKKIKTELTVMMVPSRKS